VQSRAVINNWNPVQPSPEIWTDSPTFISNTNPSSNQESGRPSHLETQT